MLAINFVSNIFTFHRAKLLTHMHLSPVAVPTRPAVCVIEQL